MTTMMSRFYISHGLAFLGGVIITVGFFYIDTTFGTTKYSKNDVSAAAALSTRLSQSKEGTGTSTEDVQKSQESPQNKDVGEIIEESTTVGDANNNSLELPQQKSSAPTTQEEVETALAEAKALLDQISGGEESGDTQVVFTTPSGLKVDEHGNIINDDGIVTTNNTTTTNSNSLPEGFFLLPSGKYMDVNGVLYDEIPATAQSSSGNLNSTYFTTPGGVVLDSFGNIISKPEPIVEEVEDTTPETVISEDNPPAIGSTIYISKYVPNKIYNNPSLTCKQLQLYGNDAALCELYKDSFDDYTWEEI